MEIAQQKASGMNRARDIGAALAAPAPMAESQEAGRFEMAQAANRPSSTEADVSATFEVADPVDLAAGGTLSMPLVDQEVKALRIALFQPGISGEHPVAALLMTNDTGTSLPPGILTVYDSGTGYVGDAQLLGMPPGEERMVSFAADRKVRVGTTSRPDRLVSEVKVSKGTLHARVASVARTTYRIEGAQDGPRTVLIEHPKRGGWEFSSDALKSETATSYRLEIRVEAGATETVEAVETYPREEVFSVTDMTAGMFTSWASEARDPETAEKLRALATARAAVSEAEDRINDTERDLQGLQDEQSRVRQNLLAVPSDSPLRTRYLETLTRQEDDIVAALDRRERQERELRAARARFEDTLEEL